MWNATQPLNIGGELPPFYAVLDIETANPSPDDLEIEKQFVRNGNTKDPEKIKAKQEGIRGGLTDSAPIFCIGIKTPHGVWSFSWASLTAEDRQLLTEHGIRAIFAKNEPEMLRVFEIFLNNLPQNTRIITANGERFDLPKLRFRYARHAIFPPERLFWFKHTDLMKTFGLFSENQFASVNEMSAKLGIEFQKTMKGADVPNAIADGHHLQVLLYNVMDCVIEERIAQRLIGRKMGMGAMI